VATPRITDLGVDEIKTIERLRAPSVIVEMRGSAAVAIDAYGRIIAGPSTDHASVINTALNALTPNRTWKEKVVLKGSFTLQKTGAAQILLPSYTILEIQGQLKLGSGVNQDAISNTDTVNGNTQIEIRGGVIDGNKANNASGRGIYLKGVTDAMIASVTVQNTAGPGIEIDSPSERIILVGNRVVNCKGYSFALYGNRTIAAHNVVYKSETIDADHFNVGGSLNAFVGNLVYNAGGGDGDGFACAGLQNSLIALNVLKFVRNGVWFYDTISQNSRNIVAFNQIHGQGTSGRYGIHIQSGDGINRVTGNWIQDFNDPDYGYGILVGGNYNTILDNEVTLNRVPISVTGSYNIVKRNRGYATEASGAATIPAGSTSVTVSHGLAAAPTKVLVTPAGNLGAVWVSNITSTSFTINCSTAPPSNTTVYWYAEI
jgi:hypothetical protein